MSFILLGILNSQAAGAGGGDVDLLSSVTLGSGTSIIDLTGLSAYSSDYKHLQLIFDGRHESGGVNLEIRPNGSTATTYVNNHFIGTGSSVGYFNDTNDALIGMQNFGPDKTHLEMWLNGWSTTSGFIKSYLWQSNGNPQRVHSAGGNAGATGTISYLRILCGGSMAAGTTVQLYGWK